jgi:ankyrin repeat protein
VTAAASDVRLSPQAANARNRLGDPAATEALDRGLWRNFEILVSHGADLRATDRAGATLLIRLALVNQFLDVERLLDRGVDINARDNRGRTLGWYVASSVVDPSTHRERLANGCGSYCGSEE